MSDFGSNNPELPHEARRPWLDELMGLGPKEILSLAGQVLTKTDHNMAEAVLLGKKLVPQTLARVDQVLGTYDQFLASINPRIASQAIRKKEMDRADAVVGEIERPEGDCVQPASTERSTEHGEFYYLEITANELTSNGNRSAILADGYPVAEELERGDVEAVTVSLGEEDEGREVEDLILEVDDPKSHPIIVTLSELILERLRDSSHDSPSTVLSNLIATEAKLAEIMADESIKLEIAWDGFILAHETLDACCRGYVDYLDAIALESKEQKEDECLEHMRVAISSCVASYGEYGNAITNFARALQGAVTPDNPYFRQAIETEEKYVEPIKATLKPGKFFASSGFQF